MLEIYCAPASTISVSVDPGYLEFAGSIDLNAHLSLAALFEKGRRPAAGHDLKTGLFPA